MTEQRVCAASSSVKQLCLFIPHLRFSTVKCLLATLMLHMDCPAGPGRAGTETTLVGSHGTRYVGQVLAGRPHGQGQYWAPVSLCMWLCICWQLPMLLNVTDAMAAGETGTCTRTTVVDSSVYTVLLRAAVVCLLDSQGVRPGQPLQLEYEGQFCRGVREGQGTAHFNSRGETYSGCWQDGRRTGPGRLRTDKQSRDAAACVCSTKVCMCLNSQLAAGLASLPCCLHTNNTPTRTERFTPHPALTVVWHAQAR